MSGETQSHSRKRRDRKKKKDSDLDKLDVKSSPDVNDEDDSCKDDMDEVDVDGKSHHDDHSHGPSSSFLSTVVFFLLLGGLVILTTMIFLELKDSKQVGPPISESRYASILGDFVDEHTHEEDDHDVPQMYTEDDDHDHDDESGGEGDIHEHSDSLSATFEQTEKRATINEDERTVEEVLDDTSQDDTQAEDPTLDLGTEEVEEELREETELEEHVDDTEAGQETEGEEPEDVTEEDERETEGEEPQDVTEEEEQQSEGVEPQDVIEEEEQQTEFEEQDNVHEKQEAEPGEQASEPEPSPDVGRSEENLEEEQIEIESEALVQESSIEAEEDVAQEVVQEEGSPSLPIKEEEEEEKDDQGTDDQEMSEDNTRDELTDPYDYEFREELDAADVQLENCRAAEQTVRAKDLYEDILRRHPGSPRALHGIAKSYDKLSEQQNSNALLEQSIHSYEKVLRSPRTTDALFRTAAERCVDRMRFRGFVEKATSIQTALIRRFPRDASLRNQLAVSYLLLGQSQMAKKVLEEVLNDHPTDGFAKVHLGFILKTNENNYKDAIRYLREGIESEEPGTVDGRFYFHLGDALTREGLSDSALKVYEDGVRKELFLSIYQRSLYNVNGLTGRPWWTIEESTYGKYLKQLEDNWQSIRDEGLALLDELKGGFLPETENLRDTGTWKQFEIYSRGRKMSANCAKAPRTCELIGGIPDAAGCKRGQVKFSIMHPGTHVWPHTGPTNCRIRAHLGLVVPDGVRIRVANETRSWIEGKFIVFDDSFEHEVWHTGAGIRLVLIVDLWHPELTWAQKENLTPI